MSAIYLEPDDEVELDETYILDQSLSFYFLGQSSHLCDNLVQVIATNMHELSLLVNAKGSGVDLVEICGGEARASQVAVRRRLKAGPQL